MTAPLFRMTPEAVDACRRIGRDEENNCTTIALPALDALCETALAGLALRRDSTRKSCGCGRDDVGCENCWSEHELRKYYREAVANNQGLERRLNDLTSAIKYLYNITCDSLAPDPRIKALEAALHDARATINKVLVPPPAL